MTENLDIATGCVEIDLGALTRNYALLSKRAAPAECAATVKANGYGHGIEHIVPALRGVGCRTFFVATPREGIEARTLAPDVAIYILDGFLPGTAKTYLAHDLRPVLGDLTEAAEWATTTDAPAALHVDTGMNRLGLSPNELAALLEDEPAYKALNIDLLMSHLACGDDQNHPLNKTQRATFDNIRTHFPKARASLGNSAATLGGCASVDDLARPGVALFGGRAIDGQAKPTEPVATVRARVLKVRDNWHVTTVGYGATRSLEGCKRIATVAVGYADGLSRHLSAGTGQPEAHVWFAGHRLPIIGRVSMDLITIDVSALPDDGIKRGDMVEVFGPNIDVDVLADRAGTIGYEFLTQLSRRFPRVTLPAKEAT